MPDYDIFMQKTIVIELYHFFSTFIIYTNQRDFSSNHFYRQNRQLSIWQSSIENGASDLAQNHLL